MFESPLTRCREGQHLAVLANPRRKPESVIFAAATGSDSKHMSMQNHLHQWFNLETNTFDDVQKLEVQNKRHGSPGVTWWRWRTWMMRCGRSFCFPLTHGRLKVASTKLFKLILFVIIPGGKRSMQTNKTGIVDITPSKWQTVAKRDSQLRNSKRHSRDTCVRVHRKDASARQLGSSLDFWWSRSETLKTHQVLWTLKILKVQGAVAIVSKIEIWPLSSLEIDNKIKIDQVIPSVLIAKKGERELDIWCWHLFISAKILQNSNLLPSDIWDICV